MKFYKWQSMISLNMPTWEKAELLSTSKLEMYESRITESDIDALYEKFGGIARYILEVDK